jgi:hypothetical protein
MLLLYFSPTEKKGWPFQLPMLQAVKVGTTSYYIFYQNMSLHQIHTFISHLHCAPNYMNAVLINK